MKKKVDELEMFGVSLVVKERNGKVRAITQVYDSRLVTNVAEAIGTLMLSHTVAGLKILDLNVVTTTVDLTIDV